MEIALFQSLKDETRSMDIYADNLVKNLSSDFQITRVQPEFVKFPKKFFLSRYIKYPLIAHKYEKDVNHIIDQSYGHLIKKLDPKKTIITCHDLIPLKHTYLKKYLIRPPKSFFHRRPQFMVIQIILMKIR